MVFFDSFHHIDPKTGANLDAVQEGVAVLCFANRRRSNDAYGIGRDFPSFQKFPEALEDLDRFMHRLGSQKTVDEHVTSQGERASSTIQGDPLRRTTNLRHHDTNRGRTDIDHRDKSRRLITVERAVSGRRPHHPFAVRCVLFMLCVTFRHGSSLDRPSPGRRHRPPPHRPSPSRPLPLPPHRRPTPPRQP